MTEITIPSRPAGARLATTAIFLINGVGIGAWAACLPALRNSLQLTDATLSLCLLAFSGGGILGMPAAGQLVARRGSQTTTIFLAVAFVLCMVLPGLAPSLPLLIAAAFVFGMGKGFLDIAMNTYASVLQNAWGAPIMSSFHAAFSVGGLIGSVGMGFLFAGGFDVLSGFLLLAAVAMTVVAVAGLLMRGTELEARKAVSGPTFVLPSRALLGVGCLCFLGMLTEGGMADWSGVYMTTVVGTTTALAAAGYAAFSLTMVAGRLLGDALAVRFDARDILRFGAGIAVLGFVLALCVATPAATIIGFALVGAGASNLIPLLFTAAAGVRTVEASVAISMTATIGYAGFLVGPPLIGFAANHAGLRISLTILVLAASIIALFANRVVQKQNS